MRLFVEGLDTVDSPDLASLRYYHPFLHATLTWEDISVILLLFLERRDESISVEK